MAMAIVRFDMRTPGLDPAQARGQYAAALEMATWADEKGFDMLVLSEHHGSDDSYLPSPLVMAGAVAGATRRIPINIAALLVPLHDPIRLAEDIAVVDLLSGGRISIVAGLGYRPVEYAMFDREWKRRGKRMDECLEVMIKAWTGKPFEYEGETVQITPLPVQQPHPMVMIGGSGEPAAKRAARFGLGLFLPLADEHLAEVYQQECERLGKQPGLVLAPSEQQPGTLFVAEDPDQAWHELGPLPVARRHDLQVVADPRHPLVGELGRDDHRRTARRGRVPDPCAGRMRCARDRARAFRCSHAPPSVRRNHPRPRLGEPGAVRGQGVASYQERELTGPEPVGHPPPMNALAS